MKIITSIVSTSILALCALEVVVSSAEMYKWVDKDGVIHFQDSPPQGVPSSTKVEKRPLFNSPETTYTPSEVAPKARKVDKAQIKKVYKVDIYTTSWCPYCKQAKAYLNSKGISYTEYDVEKDNEAMRRRNELSPDRKVPVAVIDGKVIRGFSSETYDAIFGGKP